MIEFRNAYVALLNSAKVVDNDGWTSSELGPKVDNATWQERMRAVAAASGSAGPAYLRYGGTWTMRNAAYITKNVDPVSNWQMSIKRPDNMPVENVLSAVDAAIARAQQEADDARQRERGLTGVIATFLRWPSTLREAVGPDSGAQRAAAGFVGVFAQVFVGALTAALTAGLVAGAVALWGFAF